MCSCIALVQSVFFNSGEQLDCVPGAEGSNAADVVVRLDSQRGHVAEGGVSHNHGEGTHSGNLGNSVVLGVKQFESETDVTGQGARKSDQTKGKKVHECEICHR